MPSERNQEDMEWSALLLDCVTAFLGGSLGAAVSALGGFLLFGLLGLLGLGYLLVGGNDVWINAAVGTVLLRPSVCFLGGLVAAAYARKRGLIACGKDIGRPFISYRRIELLAVAGGAGLAGYLVNRGLDLLCRGGVDTVALTVVLIPLGLKYVWGLTRSNDCEASSHAVPSPFRFFERFSRPRGKTLLSIAVALLSTVLTGALYSVPSTRAYAGLGLFLISAVSLFPLFMGLPVPATHHFSGPAGVAAMAWLTMHGRNPAGWDLLIVALWGIAAAQVALLGAEMLEKVFFTEGDIHVDPPAMGIVVSTAIMLGALPLSGVYGAGMWAQAAVALSIAVTTVLLNLRAERPRSVAIAAASVADTRPRAG
jgi:hypothetical protein